MSRHQNLTTHTQAQQMRELYYGIGAPSKWAGEIELEG
jgi:hypothetical protein